MLFAPHSTSVRTGIVLLALVLLAACKDESHFNPQQPRVKVSIVKQIDDASTASITGDIQARVQADLSFRIEGKIIERLVDVGDRVHAGQVLARLDPQDQRNVVRSAEAATEAALAQHKLSTANLWRQEQLLPKGYTSRSEYDNALANERSARNSLAAARAQLADAREQSNYTELRAEVDGVITAREAEVGQVVQAATPIFSLARDGSRDAVFNVYEALPVTPGQQLHISLLENPEVSATGLVREINPQVSAQTGTQQLKVSLQQVPEAMTLGAAVSTQVRGLGKSSVELPWSALSKLGAGPAVWHLDEQNVVQLQAVQVDRYLTDKVVIHSGLQNGDRVVVAGGQLLYPGQQVEVAQEPKSGVQP